MRGMLQEAGCVLSYGEHGYRHGVLRRGLPAKDGEEGILSICGVFGRRIADRRRK